jgi:hypothetical protein
MHDLARVSVLTPSATLADANWKARSVGDFNGDGRPDIVFHHQTADTIVLWLMNGTTVTQSVGTSSPTVNADVWRIAATADLNGDGKDDLIWQDSVNGYLASWYLNGPTVLASVSLVPYQLIDVAWQLQAAADVTGDGHPDLVWHHPTSNWLTVWVMDGISRTANLTPDPSAANAALWRLAGPR